MNHPLDLDLPAFLGFTANRLATEWYCFTSGGVLLTTQHNHGTKAGNQFIYQGGFGKNIAYASEKWIATWMIELNGLYAQKRRINGVIDQNSGSNLIMLGPSLWFSTPRLIFQAGIAPIIYQHLFGDQLKNSVFIAFNFGWTFN